MTFLILSAVFFVFIIAAHALSVFSSERVGQIFKWIGIFLHLPLMAFLFLGGVSLRLCLLIVTFSALLYTLFSYCKLHFEGKAAQKTLSGKEADNS